MGTGWLEAWSKVEVREEIDVQIYSLQHPNLSWRLHAVFYEFINEGVNTC